MEEDEEEQVFFSEWSADRFGDIFVGGAGSVFGTEPKRRTGNDSETQAGTAENETGS